MTEARWVKETLELLTRVAAHRTLKDEAEHFNAGFTEAAQLGVCALEEFLSERPTQDYREAVNQVVNKQLRENETIPLFWIRLSDLVRGDKGRVLFTLPYTQYVRGLFLQELTQDEVIVIRYMRDTMCHVAPDPGTEALSSNLYKQHDENIRAIFRKYMSGRYIGHEEDVAVDFARRLFVKLSNARLQGEGPESP